MPTKAPPKAARAPGSPALHPIGAASEVDGSDLEDNPAFASPR